jgi:YidC/Oxa1 family membrane protein insertase
LATSLKNYISTQPNFIWEDQLLKEDSLYEADLLITDRSGIAFEYAFGTERPVLFVDTPLKEHNKNWKALNIEPIELQLRNKIGVSISLDNLHNILPIIEDLLKNSNNWRETLRAIRNEHVFHWNCSAIEGAEYIKQQLKD